MVKNRVVHLFGMARPAGSSGEKAPVTRPRQRRSERTRQAILEAALKLLAAGGPSAVTHRAVAEQAGISVGATTYYFASKYDLLGEVYRLHLARVRVRAESLYENRSGLQDAGGPPAHDRFAAGLQRYLEQGVLDDRLGSLATFELALERARDPALRRRLRSAQAESDAYAAEMLRDFGSREPERDADLLIAALNGLRLAWLAAGARSKFAERVPALVERLAHLMRTER